MAKVWTIIWRTIKDRKISLITYIIVSILIVVMYVAIFPIFQEQSKSFTEILKAYPESLWKALGSSSSSLQMMSDIQAFLSLEAYGMFWVVVLCFMFIGIAGGALAAEIEKGTMEILLSLPIARLKLFFSKYLMGVLALIVFVIVSVFSAIPIAAAFGIPTIPQNYLTMALAGFMLGLAIFSIAMMFSAIFSEKSKVFFMTGGLIILMYLANVVSALITQLENLKYFSFFHYYNAADALVHNNIDLWAYPVFLGTIIVCTAIGAYVFEKRDIAV